jgi:hypothetical protein
VPESVAMPAMPMSAPEIVSTATVMNRESIPAVLPASGLRPITLKENPSRLLRISHQMTSAMARPTISETFTLSVLPNR